MSNILLKVEIDKLLWRMGNFSSVRSVLCCSSKGAEYFLVRFILVMLFCVYCCVSMYCAYQQILSVANWIVFFFFMNFTFRACLVRRYWIPRISKQCLVSSGLKVKNWRWRSPWGYWMIFCLIGNKHLTIILVNQILGKWWSHLAVAFNRPLSCRQIRYAPTPVLFNLLS